MNPGGAVRLRVGAGLALALGLPFASGGCFMFNHAKPQPPTLVINQPIVLSSAPVVNVATPAPPVVEAPPVETTINPPPPAPAHRARRTSHPRPEREAKETPTPLPAPPPVNPADLPQLTTKLSPQETEERRRSTNEWLDAAQHDLQLVANRNLAAPQEANRQQANEYIRQARQALDQADVVRAQNLAHKALVLAEAILNGVG